MKTEDKWESMVNLAFRPITQAEWERFKGRPCTDEELHYFREEAKK